MSNTLIVFLHGSGDNGTHFRKKVEKYLPSHFEKDNITMMYPSASKKCNKKTNQWFCRSPDFQKKRMVDIEDVTTINASLNDILHLILTHQSKYDHIYIGGFSMGGSLALYFLHITDYLPKNVKGIFSIGGHVVKNSVMFSSNRKKSNIPVFMMHGKEDDVIDLSWGITTYKKILSVHPQVKMNTYANMKHEITQTAMKDLFDWIHRENTV